MSALRIDKNNVSNIYPMSPMQTGLLVHGMAQDEQAYVMQLRLRLTGRLDVDLFDRTWQKLIARHDTFRTLFAFSGAEIPLQVVLSEVPFSTEFADCSALAGAALDLRIQELADRELKRPMDVRRPPLLRVLLIRRHLEDHTALVTFHHVLMDGWCQGILHEELLSIYSALAAGQEPALPPAPPFAEYIRWLTKQNSFHSMGFWREVVADAEAPSRIPGHRTSEKPFRLSRLPLVLPHALCQSLRRIGATQGASLNAVFQALWGGLLTRFCDTSTSVHGMVVSGRPPEVSGSERMVGLFINTVPLRVDLAPEETFTSLLRRTTDQIAQGMSHHHVPTAEILSACPLRDRLLTHAIAFENFPEAVPAGPGQLQISAEGDFQGYTNFDLLLLVDPSEQITVHFKYNAEAIPDDRVAMLAESLLHVAEQVARAPEARLAEVEVLTASERQRVLQLAQGEATRRSHDHDTVVGSFDAVAARRPESAAVAAIDATLTFAEFRDRANRIANGLLASGEAGPDRPVAVLFERDSWMLPALMGVLKSGSAYLPIDPDYPEQRIAFMLQDAGCRAVLSTQELLPRLPESWQGLRLDARKLAEENSAEVPNAAPRPEDLAYIIYTSGSTGLPKGVAVEHAALLNFVDGFNQSLDLHEPTRVAFIANYVFDASGRAIYPPLLRGDTVHVIDAQTRVDGTRLARTLAEHEINILDGTPTLCSLLLQAPEELRRQVRLRHVICGGEAMPTAFPDRIRSAGIGDPTIHNVYGPTETTIDSTWLRLSPDRHNAGQTVPIGRPLPNQRTYIVDRSLRLLPAGAVGELCIAGSGLARGYLNRPDLTAERFVNDPFTTGARTYRTGDRVTWNERGEIEFHGRMDNQVKVRGYRIEPGEIEKRLSDHPQVAACAVIARPTAEGDNELLGFFCSRDQDPGEDQLRRWLGETLSPHMIPARIVRLERMPLTPTGKVDRRALAATEVRSSCQPTILEPPQGSIEEKVAEAWALVLDRPRIGRHDDFFDLGGHSLRAARAAAETGKALGREVPPTWIYLASTPSAFARLLEERSEAGAGGLLDPYFVLGPSEAPPVFCLPPYGGSGIAYTGLHKALDHLRLVCFNYIPSEDFGATVAATVMQMQPQGAIHLLGYSGGGSFAFAVAKRLEQAGRSIAKLVLVDAHRRLQPAVVPAETIRREVEAFLRGAQVAVYLPDPRTRAEVRDRAVKYATELYGLSDTGTVGAEIRLLRAEDGPTIDTYADDHGALRSRSRWAECTRGRFEILAGEGTHDTVLATPVPQQNVDILREWLKAEALQEV